MKGKISTPRFIKRYGRFLKQHPQLETKVVEIMNALVVDDYVKLKIHALHGDLKGAYALRITQSYRLVFALEDDAVIFIDIGSHDDVY